MWGLAPRDAARSVALAVLNNAQEHQETRLGAPPMRLKRKPDVRDVATVTTTFDLETDELCRGFRVALIAALCPAILDGDGATFDPTEFAQPLRKSGGPSAVG